MIDLKFAGVSRLVLKSKLLCLWTATKKLQLLAADVEEVLLAYYLVLM